MAIKNADLRTDLSGTYIHNLHLVLILHVSFTSDSLALEFNELGWMEMAIYYGSCHDSNFNESFTVWEYIENCFYNL